MYLNRDMDGGPFLVYFLPILGERRLLIYVLFPSHSWWAKSCIVRFSRGMVCSRQPRSFQGVNPHGRPDEWIEDG
jgi:hypothetical protein